ncbi:MAG: hypothetical protein QNK37_00655 [Acidobacteriota bacterium]|nr:hypothetical protein [Acidobacteriota bacterium]
MSKPYHGTITVGGNRSVDNGTGLFGNATALRLRGDVNAPNGFVTPVRYDDPAPGGNQDGFIIPLDNIRQNLMRWPDHNADGVSHF